MNILALHVNVLDDKITKIACIYPCRKLILPIKDNSEQQMRGYFNEDLMNKIKEVTCIVGYKTNTYMPILLTELLKYNLMEEYDIIVDKPIIDLSDYIKIEEFMISAEEIYEKMCDIYYNAEKKELYWKIFS